MFHLGLWRRDDEKQEIATQDAFGVGDVKLGRNKRHLFTEKLGYIGKSTSFG